VASAARNRARVSPVLVVDDDPLFRELVVTILRRAGYRTLEAGSGEEGLELAERQRPEAVVLDVHLPGISGHEVCVKLGLRGERPPVLFVSGERIEPYDRVAGLLVGGDDYLVKPFAPDELLARLRALIRRARERPRPALTRDERNLVRLLRQGVGAGEVADRLGEPETAVRERVDGVLTKLGV
jgi:two-component system, OmpR family, response regulator ResD